VEGEDVTPTEIFYYLGEFERRVIIAGHEAGRWTSEAMVSIRPGKYAKHPIGKLVGTRFYCKSILAIDYYGLQKKSTAFMARVADIYSLYRLRSMYAPIVHFAEITVEDVAELAPDLQARFGEFRLALRAARFGNEKAPELLPTTTTV
jgi:hypothetical protein